MHIPRGKVFSFYYESWLMTHTINRGPYILRPRHHIYSICIMTHRIIQGPYILRPRDRIFYALKTVYFKLIFFPKNRTVYFQLKTVYFPLGPYNFKDRIFYFSGPYILLSYIRTLSESVTDYL